MEESQCGSHCHCGGPYLGLCNRLQRLQECTDRGPLSSLQTRMDLILFVFVSPNTASLYLAFHLSMFRMSLFHLCIFLLFFSYLEIPNFVEFADSRTKFWNHFSKCLLIAFASDKNKILVIWHLT